jgi:hypothetical protein
LTFYYIVDKALFQAALTKEFVSQKTRSHLSIGTLLQNPLPNLQDIINQKSVLNITIQYCVDGPTPTTKSITQAITQKQIKRTESRTP